MKRSSGPPHPVELVQEHLELELSGKETQTAKRELALELADQLLLCVEGVDISVTRRALARIVNLLGGSAEEDES